MSRITSEDNWKKAQWWANLYNWPIIWIWIISIMCILYTVFYDPFEYWAEILIGLYLVPTIPFLLYTELKFKKYRRLALDAEWKEREQEAKELDRQGGHF
jgi:hypothetical protein